MSIDKHNYPSPLEVVEASLPGLAEEIKTEIQKRESLFNQAQGLGESDMLWQHSIQVAQVAQRLAHEENCGVLAPVLVALFHDMGKFVQGEYHRGDVAEEQEAAEWADRVLASYAMTGRARREIASSLAQMYHGAGDSPMPSRIAHDADRLVKMGSWGIAQFFLKAGLRQRDIVKHLYAQGGKELTYARYAPRSMLTSSGAYWATRLSEKSEVFLRDLLQELDTWGVEDIALYEWDLSDIAGLSAKLPTGEWPVFHITRTRCPRCLSDLDFSFRIERGLKCQRLVIVDECRGCSYRSEVEYCLPELVPNLFAEGD